MESRGGGGDSGGAKRGAPKFLRRLNTEIQLLRSRTHSSLFGTLVPALWQWAGQELLLIGPHFVIIIYSRPSLLNY